MSQVLDWNLLLVDLIKLGFALLIGGLIGFEREVRDKAAGFRTLMLICTGSAVFTILSFELSASGEDGTRIAANIVSGIGFLGAGVIVREGGNIKGLTTASTVWLVAALGMAIGAGRLAFAGVAAVVILVILWLFPGMENWMESISDTNHFEIKMMDDPAKLEELELLWKASGLKIIKRKLGREGSHLIGCWTVVGPPKKQEQIIRKLLDDPQVLSLKY